MHFPELLVPGEAEELGARFQGVLGGAPQQFAARIVHREGHVVELSVTGLPIVVEGDVVGVYGIAEDITERNRFQRDLLRAESDAPHANEAKSLFLANVSHEIRTPLTSLLGTVELLEDTELDTQQAKFVDTLARSGQRLLTLVRDVLDFSRIEAGTVGVEARAFDVRAVVSEVATLVRPAAALKGLEFSCSFAPDLPNTLVGDPDRVAQVLTILLDNAIKFTDLGRVSICAAAAWSDDHDKTDLLLEVNDSGIGMHPDQQEQAFEAFSQADPSITRKYGGTGLGLAICRQLVEMMHGTITLQSAPDAGSTVRVTLPLRVAAPRRRQRPAQRAPHA